MAFTFEGVVIVIMKADPDVTFNDGMAFSIKDLDEAVMLLKLDIAEYSTLQRKGGTKDTKQDEVQRYSTSKVLREA